jgi:transcriptional regulator
MYVPTAFAETDVPKLHAFIEKHGFGMLVSQHDALPFVTHLPLMLEREGSEFGCLVGHVARANPQWRQAIGQTVLAVFAGPHVYVSPTWYEAEQVVPTWNYVAVHAYGRLEIIDDAPALTALVSRLVEKYERAMPRPWALDERSTFFERMLAQIIGFRVRIERLEGKWKLNQNHPEERRRKVIDVLSQGADENSLEIARLMTATLPGRS